MKNILLVEDDPLVMKTLKKFFKKLGFGIKTATNGKEALQQVEKYEIYLIISDLKMPVMKGDALFAEVRDRGFKMPFFLLTGYTDHTSIEILKNMGIQGVIEKPVEFKKLENALKGYLGSPVTKLH